jgi:hypothetical protein
VTGGRRNSLRDFTLTPRSIEPAVKGIVPPRK